jgi:hypothetical protein
MRIAQMPNTKQIPIIPNAIYGGIGLLPEIKAGVIRAKSTPTATRK